MTTMRWNSSASATGCASWSAAGAADGCASPRRPREGRAGARDVPFVALAGGKQGARVLGRDRMGGQRTRRKFLQCAAPLHDDQPVAHMVDHREVVADEHVG